MLHHTPLRYPGGKRRLASVVMGLLEENGLQDVEYCEPFAGGAAVALGLLFEEYASRIHLNDLCRPVYAFWHCALNASELLCDRIDKVKISMAEWRRQRKIYENRQSASLEELGFSALFLNRTNRSGIIRGGVIGGKRQDGDWSLDVRFNKAALIDRLQKIRRYRDRIKIYQLDGVEFANRIVANLGAKTFAFFDPPYIQRSRMLYMNTYKLPEHQRLEACVGSLAIPWIVTYDMAAIEHRLYGDFRRIVYGLHYTAHEKYQGREVMFFSNGLRLPPVQFLASDTMQIVASESRLRQHKMTPAKRANQKTG